MQKIAWISTWSRVCGIADYAKALWPSVQARLQSQNCEGHLLSLDEYPNSRALIGKLREIKPDLVHFQHEYGIYGGKNPPFYWFPELLEDLKQAMPGILTVATAHTVLSPTYRFSVKGRGFQAPVRALANILFLPRLRKIWGSKTWGSLSGVIVHSRHQIEWLSVKNAQVIPHYVPALGILGTVARADTAPSKVRRILVFGFFTPEKGQDLAIKAFSIVSKNEGFKDVRLVLAGGVRRNQDQAFFTRCRDHIYELKLADKIEVTGFVESRLVDSHYQKAALVLAPFKETTGSGSLAQALARGAAVLTSDLALNQEINERQAGTLALYRTQSAEDCAAQIMRLLKDDAARQALKSSAKNYAQAQSPPQIAEQHMKFYQLLASQDKGSKP